MSAPNVVYLHSHDTGRHVSPYGHAVDTPSIKRVAREGRLYRRAFSAAPVCSPSRAALLTGQHPHETGMLGLAHRGFRLREPARHLANALRPAGYTSALVGMQHEAAEATDLGYDRVVEVASTHVRDVAPAAAALLREGALPEPFFLSVGFFETHRPFGEGDGAFVAPPAQLPDTPETRRDMAGFLASARELDRGVGIVADAVGPDSLLILTTDHGPPFPGAKATLGDRGLGVLLILRGLGLRGVSDALVSQLDVYPTVCAVAGLPTPAWARGRSLLDGEGHDAVFGELTFHAAYEPVRSVRTGRHRYVRRFGDGLPVLANIDDGPSKALLVAGGLAERAEPVEALYDLLFDPGEARNLAGDPAHAGVLDGLRSRLEAWMAETDDPLLDGPVAPPPGAVLNLPGQASPDDPTVTAP